MPSLFTIRIMFVPADFKRVMTAIEKVRSAVRVRAQGIGYQMASDYAELVHLNILSQKFAGSYDWYSDFYQFWKEQRTGHLDFWVLGEDLLNAISTWKVRGAGAWMAGIPAGILDSGGKNYSGSGPPHYVAAYARILEYGGSFAGQTHPERPVFRPTFDEYLEEGAMTRFRQSVEIIKRNWR